MESSDSRLVAAVLANWKQVLGQIDKGLAAMTDDDLQAEVAPGRNRLYYLLGHLTAVHDRMLPLLRIGERTHPELDEQFIVQPDRDFSGTPAATADLRKGWTEVNGKLTSALERLTPAEWLERHSSVSEEDFAKEPHRNRLTVFLSRTSHAAMHEGQMRLVKAGQVPKAN